MNEQAKHTPQFAETPWRQWDRRDVDQGILITDATGTVGVCRVIGESANPKDARRLTQAHADLIVAAPAMLAELIETANWLDERAGVVEKIGRAGRMGERPNAEATAEAARLRGRAALIRQTIILQATGGA